MHTLRAGFTLIELLVVLALLVLLMSFIIPSGSRLLDNVKTVLSTSEQEREIENKKYDAFIKAVPNSELNITAKGIML